MPTPVSVSDGPPITPYTQRYSYDASGNLEYIGWAQSRQPESTVTVSSVSAANPAAFTATAHGLASNQPVTITGATGDWAALNGTHIVTVSDANTFTVAVNSSAFSGSFNGVVKTTAPRSNRPCWSLQKLTTGTDGLALKAWGGDQKAWDSRTTYSYQ
jgi:hypothetical protein